MLGDTAVAVNPEDERYTEIIGALAELPLTDRKIPVIADDYVDPEFGTGCLKITPAHDFNDYAVGERHGLPLVNIFTPDAKLNENAPERYQGMDRFAARERIVADLEARGLLEKVEPHRMMVPRGDRSHSVIEPYLTDQWFVKAAPLAEPSIEAVGKGDIRFVPEHWTKTYFEWMRNIQDWCISRQIWWGHRIPAWYDEHGGVFVGAQRSRSSRQIRSGRLRRIAPGRGRARHVVLVRAVAVFHPGLAGEIRATRDVLSNQRAGHRLRHHFLLGRANDHVRAQVHGRRAFQ